MLKGKTVLLGVSGSIAAYKAADLASLLVKQHANVNVILTKGASHFIGAETFEALTGNRCYTDVFDRSDPARVLHIALAKEADVFLIAPASADTIAKLACGLADDMLSSAALARTCPLLVAPAMNTHMYAHPATTRNLETLKRDGAVLLEPESGRLACGDSGKGKLPPPSRLLEAVLWACETRKDLKGKRVLVTAGPTREAIDPVRFISNHSTGKMGYACARAALRRGARVTLVTGATHLPPPAFLETVNVTSASEMADAVLSRAKDQDIIISAAAVSDYTPETYVPAKIKKSQDLHLPLKRTCDILSTLGQTKGAAQCLVGFAMETEHLLENARLKLEKKNLDLVCANNLFDPGAGFACDTNHMTLVSRSKETPLPLLSKDETADRIIDEILML